MSGVGPFTRRRVFRFAPAHGTERVENVQREGGRLGARVSLALGFGGGGVKVLYQ